MGLFVPPSMKPDMTSSTPEDGNESPEAAAAVDSQPPDQRLSIGRLAAAVSGLVIALFVVLLASNIGGAGRSDPHLLVGKLVPEVQGTTMAGESLDIDTYRGKWVAINFFASWCVACQQEHPELVKWRADHVAKGDAELVMIVMGDTDKAVREFFAERGGGDWPVLGQAYENYSLTFGVTAVPETFMVSPSGLIAAHLTGAVTAEQLDGVLQRYSQGS